MDQQRITIGVIETKEFRVAARGYDQHEVDEFLDCICDELERMEGEVADLQAKLEMAKAMERKAEAAQGSVQPAAPAPRSASVDEIIAMTIKAAEDKAEEITKAAELRAEEIIAAAESKAADRLGNLEEEHKTIAEQVEGLKASAKEYREKFAELLRVHQEALEQVKDL